jgi:hypothetical protein
MGVSPRDIRPAKQSNNNKQDYERPSGIAALNHSRLDAASKKYTRILRGIGRLESSSDGSGRWRIVLEPVSVAELDAAVKAIQTVRKVDKPESPPGADGTSEA